MLPTFSPKFLDNFLEGQYTIKNKTIVNEGSFCRTNGSMSIRIKTRIFFLNLVNSNGAKPRDNIRVMNFGNKPKYLKIELRNVNLLGTSR